MKTVAEQIGQTPHLSPLLRRLRRIGFGDPEALRRLAVLRGCNHYRKPEDASDSPSDPGADVISNEELAIALLCGAQQFGPGYVRCAAQLISGDDISADRLVRLAREERATPVLRHIAMAGSALDEIGRDQWRTLLDALPARPDVSEGRLPHSSRFVSATGLVRRERKLDRAGHHVWLRPRKSRSTG